MHAELDRELVVGHPVTYADRQRLPYVEAVLLEAMRLAPVVALALPHFTAVDVNISTSDGDQLTIPAGSLVIANLWSVGRDPDVWSDEADTFRPERFLRRRSGTDHAATTSASTSSCPFAVNTNDDELDLNSDGSTRDDGSGSCSLVVDGRLAESIYPFSFGARRCVGESLGRLQIFVFFANIMRSCRLLQVNDSPPSSDGETYGDVIRPAPYKIRILPR